MEVSDMQVDKKEFIKQENSPTNSSTSRYTSIDKAVTSVSSYECFTCKGLPVHQYEHPLEDIVFCAKAIWDYQINILKEQKKMLERHTIALENVSFGHPDEHLHVAQCLKKHVVLLEKFLKTRIDFKNNINRLDNTYYLAELFNNFANWSRKFRFESNSKEGLCQSHKKIYRCYFEMLSDHEHKYRLHTEVFAQNCIIFQRKKQLCETKFLKE